MEDIDTAAITPAKGQITNLFQVVTFIQLISATLYFRKVFWKKFAYLQTCKKAPFSEHEPGSRSQEKEQKSRCPKQCRLVLFTPHI